MLYIYLINTQYTKNTCFWYYLCWTQHWEDNCPRQLSQTFWQLPICSVISFAFPKPPRMGTPTPLHVSHQQNRRAVNCSGPTRLCNLDRLLQLLPVSSHHWSCRLLLYGRRKMSVPQNTHKVPSVVVRETRSGR